MIHAVEVKKIKNHPYNARKDLGDLTELTESIKQNGILQNLTIVPDPENEGEYLAVIGNRRLAAAALAGLETVPCVISNMSHADQIKAMLLENMQRRDLTVYEQAQGFQMMMDLGASIADISKDTGFSTSTIRHRIKLNELDKETLEKKCTGTISMTDLIKLEDIKDVNKRNEVLKKIGTNNFQWAYNDAIAHQKRKENVEEIKDRLIEGLPNIVEIEKSNPGVKYIQGLWNEIDVKKFIEEKKDCIAKLYFKKNTASYGAAVEIYEEKNANDEEEASREKIEVEKRKERREKYKNLYDKMVSMWDDFATNISIKKLQEKREQLNKYVLLTAIDYSYNLDGELCDFFGIDEEQDFEDVIKNLSDTEVLRWLFVSVYLTKKVEFYYMPLDTYYGGYKENSSSSIKEFYSFLAEFGYQASEEELQIVDGTHEIYVEEEEE